MSTIDKTFSNGEVIIREGDSGNTFFQLIEGSAAVYKDYGEEDQVKIAVLEQGQYFGEMAVIENYPRSSTVVADGDCKVTEIAAEQLKDYLSENPDKIISIMKVLGNRIKSMTDECNQAKKALDDARKETSSNKYDGFFNMMRKQSIYFSNKNFQMERPSAEALREAGKGVESSDKTETYPYGTIIFKQGEDGRSLYIVHEGSIGLFTNYGEANELKLTDVEPVACFGEMGMLSDEPRTATAVVQTSGTRVEIIDEEDLEGLFKSNPEKIDMILKNLSYRLRSITYDYYKACQEIYEASKDD
ncbi:MAG: cyclic nucleotide-binding domain-containing protein [Saccharofermentans sp.]|nr:cyclic nucleotide-binding domain-containing protein [Saccharofermentans sp.]